MRRSALTHAALPFTVLFRSVSTVRNYDSFSAPSSNRFLDATVWAMFFTDRTATLNSTRTRRAGETSRTGTRGQNLSRVHPSARGHTLQVGPARAAEWARILGYGEKQFIRYALQDLVRHEGLECHVNVA